MDTSLMDSRFIVQPRQRKTAPAPPKKRKIQHAVEEITWDKDARTEYLTGFHKRKLARKKHAQEINEEKARQERIAMRKQMREERKQAVEEHVQTITKILRDAEAAGTTEQGKDNEDEWDGLSDTEIPEAPPLDLEEEYIDEDKYTTVTVEAVSVDRDGLHKTKIESSDDESDAAKKAEPKTEEGEDKKGRKPKEKKKKFRYETKFDRDLAARKHKAKKRKAQGRD